MPVHLHTVMNLQPRAARTLTPVTPPPGRRYAHLRHPRRATYDVTRPQPAAFLARLMGQALNHGLPSRERGASVRAALGRRNLPTGPLAAVLRARPRHASVTTDALVRRLLDHWQVLAAASTRLPATPPLLSVLTLERSSASTSFVFGDDPLPLLLVKAPRPGNEGVDQERRFLELVAAADVAPRLLGELPGPAYVQEGLPGAVVRVDPVTPGDAHLMPWRRRDDELVAGLARLAETTAGAGTLQHQLLRPLDRALDAELPERVRRLVRAARDDLGRTSVTVVQHKDLSAQNWLVDGERLVGFVDWEFAVADGVPGFDALHVAVATLEHGVGLTRWSDDNVVDAFRAAWDHSPLFAGARAAVGTTSAAAGVEGLTEQLTVAHFARRLGRRLEGSGPEGMSIPTLTAMLLTVAGDGT